MSKPRPHDETHTTIKCVDCGAPREVRNQDKHQVNRCITCQKNHRLSRRNELRQNEIANTNDKIEHNEMVSSNT
jgi:hypothetical protein